MLKNMKLMPKLLSGFSIVALIGSLIGIVGYSGISHVSGAVQEISYKILPSSESLYIIAVRMEEINNIEKLLLIRELNDEKRNAYYGSFKIKWSDLYQEYEKYDGNEKTEKQDSLWNKFVPAFKTWEMIYFILIL